MTLQRAPYSVDQEALALRDRFELAVIRDDDKACAEAARALFWFCADHPEYRIFQLAPSAATALPEKPQRIVSKYDGRCRRCTRLIVVGEIVFWTPGTKGADCSKCGESKL